MSYKTWEFGWESLKIIIMLRVNSLSIPHASEVGSQYEGRRTSSVADWPTGRWCQKRFGEEDGMPSAAMREQMAVVVSNASPGGHPCLKLGFCC
jgi:hypothetical protein